MFLFKEKAVIVSDRGAATEYLLVHIGSFNQIKRVPILGVMLLCKLEMRLDTQIWNNKINSSRVQQWLRFEYQSHKMTRADTITSFGII